MSTDPADLMYPTLLDTKTGETVVAEEWGSDEWYWSEGNGSCDCNRSLCFSNGLHKEIEAQHGQGVCFGCKRIVVVDLHGYLGGAAKEELIAEMNREYPDELRHSWDKSIGGAQ